MPWRASTRQPDRAGYARARAAAAHGHRGAAEQHGAHAGLLDHLYLIRLALLDRESVARRVHAADAADGPQEIVHAP